MNGHRAAIFVSAVMDEFEIARANMIVSQVRPNGITEPRLIEAMARVPRETFVPAERRHLAYMDEDVAVKPGRFLMEPMALARLLQLAVIASDDDVLHVGCATGYGSAVLAQIARRVVAIDEDRDLVSLAKETLASSGVTFFVAPHAKGVPDAGPFDVIFIDGRVPAVPPALLAQLKDDGRLVAVVGMGGTASAKLFRKHGGSISERTAFDASVAVLPGFTVDRPAFVF
ncbi:protein-L-isoaspartate O-methyltransferase [soil metagenome]